MELHIDQPCFVEAPSRSILIEKACIVAVTESGGTLRCDSDARLPAQAHRANLVVFDEALVRRIPIVLDPHESDALNIAFKIT